MDTYLDILNYKKIAEKDVLGFIPAPVDSCYDEYLARVEETSSLLQEKIPSFIEEPLLKSYTDRVEKLLQTSCCTISVQVDKKKLLFWEPGVSWIEEYKSLGYHIYKTQVQFHPSLFLPSRSTFAMSPFIVILHEYIHALRAPLSSSKYEEYVAYTVSKMMATNTRDKIRCILGPLFESQKEVWIFFILSYLGSFFLIYHLQIDTFFSFLLFQCIYNIAIMLPFLIRLGIKWHRILYVFEHLQKSVQNSNKLVPLFIRISDSDIETIYTKGYVPKDWRWEYYSYQYEL